MRSLKNYSVVIGMVAVLAIGCFSSGCDEGKSAKKPVGETDVKKDDKSQGHAPHGPMNGEIADIPGSDMIIECYAKYGMDLVAFAMYESDAKTSKKVKCDSFIGRIAAAPDKEFEIEAIDTEEGLSGKFEIVDTDFAIARKKVGVKLEIEIDGKKYVVEFPKDPHY